MNGKNRKELKMKYKMPRMSRTNGKKQGMVENEWKKPGIVKNEAYNDGNSRE